MLAANQRKSLAVQRLSGLVGGEYMAASCSEYLELQNIWDYAAMFATRRVIRNTSASGTWQTSMPALSMSALGGKAELCHAAQYVR